MRMNVALVGCGGIARYHVKALSRMDTIKLVAACDIVEKKAAKMAAEWNIPHYYTSFSEMLDKESPSIISILTPTQTHAPLAVEAVNHRINVMSEKPLTLTTQDAASIHDSLKRNKGVKLTVNYNILMTRVMRKALSMVRNGQIGEILGVDIQFLNTKEDPMASDKNHWCHRLPGGRFGAMLPHPVYIAQAILGDSLEVLDVQSEKRGNYSWMRHDELHAIVRGSAGVATIYVSFNCPRQAVQVRIYGRDRILLVDTLDQTLIELGPRVIGKMGAATDSLRLSWKLLAHTARNAVTYVFREPGQASFQMTYSSLMNSITNDYPPIVTPEMAYHTVEIDEKICKEL
jgi:predicted dehydrogenase